MIEYTDSVRRLLDQGNYVLSIFVDLTKAFDTVDHEILLYKLERYGIRGHANDFFRSYLSNRQQYTVINGAESSRKTVKCGVPQGSVLGPILFLVYINDMYTALQEDSVRLFADDTSLTLFDRSFKTVLAKAKDQFSKLRHWCTCNKLTINQDKTFLILFHATNKPVPLNFSDITVDDFIIKRVTNVKYIGLNIDEKLNWREHVYDLCKSLIKYFGIFNKVKYFVTSKLARQLYFAFIYSRINYGIEVYGVCAKSLMQKLQILQSKLLKLLLRLDSRTSTNKLHKELNILKVQDVYKVNILHFVNTCLNGNCPEIFEMYFSFHQPLYSTRSQGTLAIPRSRTTLGSLSSTIRGPNLWNTTNNNILRHRHKI